MRFPNPFASEVSLRRELEACANLAEPCALASAALEAGAYAALAFAIPIALASQQQLVVGTAVNLLLLAGAFYSRGPLQLLPLVVLPSLGAIAAGALFGGLTPLLLLFAPAIWLGNAALVVGVKYCRFVRNWGYGKAVASAVALKVALIGGTALALYSLAAVPWQFLFAMSAMQLATAASAGALFWPVFKARS